MSEHSHERTRIGRFTLARMLLGIALICLCLGVVIRPLVQRSNQKAYQANWFQKGLGVTVNASRDEEVTELHVLRLNDTISVSREVGQLPNVADLIFQDHRMMELPTGLGQLTSLKSIRIFNAQIKTLPSEIGEISELRELCVRDSQLTQLPKEIERCRNLRSLSLSGNQLTSLPDEIGNIRTLRLLFLDRNSISSLPPRFAKLTKLESLTISSNPITDSDLGILSSLQRLKSLDITNTEVTRDGVHSLHRALPDCNIFSDWY